LHRIVSLEPGARVAPELMMLLNIPERTYGESKPVDEPADSSIPIATESITSVLSDSSDAQVSTSESSTLSIARLVLLILSALLLNGIVIWRFRSRRAARNDNTDRTTGSSTYLPLAHKPSETMAQHMGEGTNSGANRTSANEDEGDSTKPRGSR